MVVPKSKGEILGVVIVESGWGSMLPTIVLANLSPSGPAARCGQLNIGDQVRINTGSTFTSSFTYHYVSIFHSDHRHQRHIAGRPPAFNLSELHQGSYGVICPLVQLGASFLYHDEKDERIFELSPPLPGPPREGGYRAHTRRVL